MCGTKYWCAPEILRYVVVHIDVVVDYVVVAAVVVAAVVADDDVVVVCRCDRYGYPADVYSFAIVCLEVGRAGDDQVHVR